MPISETLLKKIILATIFLTFLLLLFKNPFSQRNLIPNLEPFPDTIHYLNPPLSFLEGKGFLIEREDRTFRPAVPFLYSASLIPGFLIYPDARFFYFTNIILAFLGLLFFYKFLGKFLTNSYINLLVLFLYITNYFVYWYPNLPMSENLLLTLYLAGLYLLVSKVTIKNAFLAGVVGISFYATKYASVSLTSVYLGFYFIKIFLSLIPEFKKFNLGLFKDPKKNLKKNIFVVPFMFILGTTLALVSFFQIDSFIRGNNIFAQLLEHATPLAASKGSSGSASQPSGWFNIGYFQKHFFSYIDALTGKPMRFLWDNTPLTPRYIALTAIAGIFLGLLKKQYRVLSSAFIFLILMPIIAISPFYTTDARYIYHVIPTLLAGFGLFLVFIFDLLNRYKLKRAFYVLLISLFVFYAGTNFQRLKYQIALNLKHTETPWYYMSVKNFNNYFKSSQNNSSEKPILITALQPFYIDFFSNSNYKLLPLSKDQEFIRRAETVWGSDDYSDLIALYKKYLSEEREVYVTNAALGNEGYLHNGFNSVKENFTLEEVNKGCFDTCNIYQLHLRGQ